MATHVGLHLRSLGIDTHQEHVAYIHRSCPVCGSEGLEAQTRVEVRFGDRWIIATLNVVDSVLLAEDEIGLSTSAQKTLHAKDGDHLTVVHAPALDSLSPLRSKIYGHRLDKVALESIVGDIAAGRYSNIHISAFLTAVAAGHKNVQEAVDLTRAMVEVGDQIDWGHSPIADKHCVGGLPGNRTTPIVVAIVTSAGLTMPKTSSRAITSPAGTADVMEVLTPVELDLTAMRRVVEREGGCLVWGGSLTLSPADDVLIRVARHLEIDSDTQLVASVLSKKIAAGATHGVIDIPVGPTAKVRTKEAADKLQVLMEKVAFAHGLNIQVVRSAGIEPVGHGIGPALEARDVLSVLRCEPQAPGDLRQRALTLAGTLLEFCGKAQTGAGLTLAANILDSGQAWAKFQAICLAQGGLNTPGVAPLQRPVLANAHGVIRTIDNRRLARVAKLAGAPRALTAGLDLHVRLGDVVVAGQPLFTVHAAAQGELAYAFEYLEGHPVIMLVPH